MSGEECIAMLTVTGWNPIAPGDAAALPASSRRAGTGVAPKQGDVCVVHWAGRTKNYQASPAELCNLTGGGEPSRQRSGGGDGGPEGWAAPPPLSPSTNLYRLALPPALHPCRPRSSTTRA